MSAPPYAFAFLPVSPAAQTVLPPSPSHSPGSSVAVYTARGVRVLTSSVVSAGISAPVATGPRAAVLTALFSAIVFLLGTIPDSSLATMERSHRYLHQFLTWIGAALPTPWLLCAYIMMRVFPPLDLEIPPFVKRGLVSAATIATEISSLRRYVSLRSAGHKNSETARQDAALESSVNDPMVSNLLRKMSDPRQTKTKKLPILFSMILPWWESLTPEATRLKRRDVTLILVGLCYGLRRSEVAGLTFGDVHWVPAEAAYTLIIRSDKTNQSALGTHSPKDIYCGHDIWIAALHAWLQLHPSAPLAAPLFSNTLPSHLGQKLSMRTVGNIAKRLFPKAGVTSHSMRVGFATELFAAGVQLPIIMEMGRWSSLAALIYVLPAFKTLIAASRQIGTSSLTIESYQLRRQLLTQDPAAFAAKVNLRPAPRRPVPSPPVAGPAGSPVPASPLARGKRGRRTSTRPSASDTDSASDTATQETSSSDGSSGSDSSSTEAVDPSEYLITSRMTGGRLPSSVIALRTRQASRASEAANESAWRQIAGLPPPLPPH